MADKIAKKVVIIGSGMMGSALAFPARENGLEVALVGTPLDREIIDTCRKTGQHPKFNRKFPAGLTYYQFEEVNEALKDADFVIGGVSSFGVEWFWQEVLLKLPASLPVLSVTKGLINLDDGTLISYPDYWQRKLAEKGVKRHVCAIGGPCTSYELVFHDQSEVAFCGPDAAELRMMRRAMATKYYHISLTKDVVGLESAVALKNGYALGIALTIGLCEQDNGEGSGLHYNSQAAAFFEAVREMKRLLKMQGATDECESIGFGDLYVTVYGGRTRKIGILLGKGIAYDKAVEMLQGVTLESLVVARRVAAAVKAKAARGLCNLKDFPLLMHVDGILDHGKDAHLPWDSFTFEEV